jgi:DNA repair exonuclease SbcCD ATPase subunit
MEQDERVKIHERLTTLEGSMKTVYNRVDDAEIEIKEIKSDNKILHEMNTNIAVLATNYANLGKEVGTIQSDIRELKNKPSPQETLITQGKEIQTLKTEVKELQEKPAKRWNTLETVVITAIVGAVIGYAVSKIFGG